MRWNRSESHVALTARACEHAFGVVMLLLVGCQSTGMPPGTSTLRTKHDEAACAQDAASCATDDATVGDDAGSVGAAARDAGCKAPDTGSSALVTLERLLWEMVDLRTLSELPSPAYAAHLASSHDRASDTAKPTDANWFANRDAAQLKANTPLVLLDVRGPGALTRLWSAAPSGIVRIYLDGSTKPVIEADLKALLSGQVAPYAAPFGATTAAGHTLYFPIPYARSCRVTVTAASDAHLYYHVSYRSYARGALVETLDHAMLARAQCVRSMVAQRLSELTPQTRATDSGEQQVAMLDPADPAKASLKISAGAGGGALWELRMRPSTLTPEALRGTILTLEFDGEQTVRAPLGDFFAAALQLRTVNSVPVAATTDGELVSRWPMPFAKYASIGLQSSGVGAATAALVEVVHGDYAWGPASLHLRTYWHAPDTFPSSPPRDWALGAMLGEGYYVGNVLHVVNRAPGWWGEGDEKVYVDDATFPTFFGTGSEDYYGYAWCSNQAFSAPYTGQPVAPTRRNFGYTSLYRFQILDPIPFQTSLRFDLEVRHWGDAVDVTYDALSFWYTRPGAQATGPTPPADSFRIPALGTPEPDVPAGPYQCGH